MKKFTAAILLAVFFTFSHCEAQTKKRTTVSKKTSTRTVSKKSAVKPAATSAYHQEMLLCYTLYGMPAWHLAVVNGFRYPVDMVQPAHYKLLSINNELFRSYLATIPFDSSKKRIQLPLYSAEYLSCKDYLITRVVTMDSALQARYPQLMSFKAVDENNPLNTARIDCDGKDVRIMIHHEGQRLFITPVEFNRRTYYACYSLDDPNFVKQPFAY